MKKIELTPFAVAVKHVAPKFAVSGLVSSARNGTVSPSSLRGTGSIRAVVPRIRYVTCASGKIGCKILLLQRKPGCSHCEPKLLAHNAKEY